MQAMLKMKRIDITGLQQAYDRGEPAGQLTKWAMGRTEQVRMSLN